MADVLVPGSEVDRLVTKWTICVTRNLLDED